MIKEITTLQNLSNLAQGQGLLTVKAYKHTFLTKSQNKARCLLENPGFLILKCGETNIGSKLVLKTEGQHQG